VAVALTVKNNVYFVIFTILEFVGLLIFLNDIVGIALMSTRVNRTGQSLPEQEQNELGCSVFRRIDLRVENRL
jgi:type IV secretory pathway VirB3-like protein